jgi:Protein of unknown function (DUF4230)
MAKYLTFFVLLLLFGGAAFYFGRISGKNQATTTFVNNVAVVKQIAELAALQVQGTTSVKFSNASQSTTWGRFKNFLSENTLLITVPYIAKYGVDLQGQTVSVAQNQKTITVQLPNCKLLSLQLEMDKVSTMNQTGIFANTSVNDVKQAQQDLYNAAIKNLSTDTSYLNKAQAQIVQVLNQYYQPLGYMVVLQNKP